MIIDKRGFVVLAGSEISPTTAPCCPKSIATYSGDVAYTVYLSLTGWGANSPGGVHMYQNW